MLEQYFYGERPAPATDSQWYLSMLNNPYWGASTYPVNISRTPGQAQATYINPWDHPAGIFYQGGSQFGASGGTGQPGISGGGMSGEGYGPAQFGVQLPADPVTAGWQGALPGQALSSGQIIGGLPPAATTGVTAGMQSLPGQPLSTGQIIGSAAGGGWSPPWWLPEAIKGAGVLAGTMIQAKGASNAAKIQGEAADKALALQRQQYEETKANYAPFLSGGTGAFNTMLNLSGIAGAGPASMTPSATGGGIPTGGATPPPPPEPSTPPIQTAEPQTLAAIQNVIRPQNTSSYTTMQAPDGSTQAVPAQFVDYYRQKGARVLA